MTTATLMGTPSVSRDRNDRIAGAERVRSAEVAQKPRAAFAQQWEEGLDTPRKTRVVAERRILAPSQLRECDRSLGEAFERKHVELAALQQLDGRIEPVARESGAAADAKRARHHVVRVTRSLFGLDPRRLDDGRPFAGLGLLERRQLHRVSS